jgi:hypothetical protein
MARQAPATGCRWPKTWRRCSELLDYAQQQGYDRAEVIQMISEVR